MQHPDRGTVPSSMTIELQADGAELCVTSDAHEVIDAMFVALPDDYETGELVSAVVTDRQISRITSVMTGRSERSPLSTWLEAGHHLVLVERPGYVTMAWDAAAIQPVIVEAGGSFTDWRGEPTIYSGEGVATNAHVRDEVLAVTRARIRHDN